MKMITRRACEQLTFYCKKQIHWGQSLKRYEPAYPAASGLTSSRYSNRGLGTTNV